MTDADDYADTYASRRMRQAHRFSSTPARDFVKLASRFYSSCIGCNGQIEPGTPIMWAHGCGSCCTECFRVLKGGSK